MNKVFVLFLLFGSFTGCEQVEEREITAFGLQQQFQEILNLVDSGNCSENSQCSFMKYGSKACGGPQGYFVFSSNIDVEALQKKVNKYTEDERLYNIQVGAASDCMFVTPPDNIGCIDGTCAEITN